MPGGFFVPGPGPRPGPGALFSGEIMTNIKALIKQAKRRTETVKVCLRGDLADEYDQLSQQLAELPDSNKLGGDPERTRIEAELDRLRTEMTEGTVDFKLQALPDKAFQELVDEHPPRRRGDDPDEMDARMGFNRSTFYPVLIRACTIEPELDAEDWNLLLGDDGSLSAGQRVDLNTAALNVNSKPVDVPFSRAASNGSPG
jgi:hypothetical protein